MRNALAVLSLIAAGSIAAAQSPQPPSYPLQIRDLNARFDGDGTFLLEGKGWPAFKGTWKAAGNEVELLTPGAPDGCDKAGRYRFQTADGATTFQLVSDACEIRRLLLDGCRWMKAGEKPPIPERKIVRTAAARLAPLAAAPREPGAWPSFRGAVASGKT
jgi:hypothetical protein